MMLRAPEEYQYLMNSGCTSVAGVDDEKARSRTPGPAGHARRAVGIRMAVPTTERLFWHCGDHTAKKAEIGLHRPIPHYQNLQFSVALWCGQRGVPFAPVPPQPIPRTQHASASIRAPRAAGSAACSGPARWGRLPPARCAGVRGRGGGHADRWLQRRGAGPPSLSFKRKRKRKRKPEARLAAAHRARLTLCWRCAARVRGCTRALRAGSTS